MGGMGGMSNSSGRQIFRRGEIPRGQRKENRSRFSFLYSDSGQGRGGGGTTIFPQPAASHFREHKARAASVFRLREGLGGLRFLFAESLSLRAAGNILPPNSVVDYARGLVCNFDCRCYMRRMRRAGAQKNPPSQDGGFFCSLSKSRLFALRCELFRLGDCVVAVHLRDEVERDSLRANRLAFAVVRAVAEAEFVHLLDHCDCAPVLFGCALRQVVEVRDLSRREEDCRSVRASRNARAATDGRRRRPSPFRAYPWG